MIFSCFGTFRELAVLFRGTQRGINKGIVTTHNRIRELFNSAERLNQYMPASLNGKQAEDYVLNALSHYKKYIERKNSK